MALKLENTEKIMLPPEFEYRMRKMLGAEYEIFEKSLWEGPYQAFRINTLKADPKILLKQLPFPVRRMGIITVLIISPASIPIMMREYTTFRSRALWSRQNI